MPTVTADEGFVVELQRLLEHLYDPSFVRDSPILELLLSSTRRSAAGLQRLLSEAIQALLPAPDVPIHTQAWRVYHILRWRYVEQSGQVEVAQNLSLSRRHLRRQERVAVQALADHLWVRYRLGERYTPSRNTPPQDAASLHQEKAPDRHNELEWLGESVPTETDSIVTLIRQGIDVVEPLAQSQGTRINLECQAAVTEVTGQISVLRQAIISLLTAALLASQNGVVTVRVSIESQALRVDVDSGNGSASGNAAGGNVVEQIDMARQLVALWGGTLNTGTATARERSFSATLSLPGVAENIVLVIDDNADALRLVQRFLARSAYRFVGSRDPERTIPLAESLRPRAILLDIMLPGVDGWELLGRLREHPTLRKIPVIVCTILPQAKLATTLGAAAFIRKPIRREPLLSALTQLAPVVATGSSPMPAATQGAAGP